MKTILTTLLLLLANTATAQYGQPRQPLGTIRSNPFDSDSISNPFGAGSPFKANGLMNPYSQYGSPHSNRSWSNPFATEAPKLYDNGQYRGRLSTNRFDTDSTSNPFGRYGSPFSADSIRNPFGAGNPFSQKPLYVFPAR